MSHRAALAVILALGPAAPLAADDAALPPGASLRLGDTRFRAGGEVADLLFSADATELTARVTVGTTTRVVVWDAATGEPLRTATEARRPGTRVRWSATTIPESTRGVVIDAAGVAVVRDFAADKDLVRLTGHYARVTAVAVSADGRRIATGAADGLIRVWDAETFRPVVEVRGHAAAVRAVEVSADGRTALTTGADGTARVWNLGTGRELRAFPTAGDAPAVFTPDGAAVRVPVADGRVVVRDLVTGLEVVSPTARRADPLAPAAWLLRQAGVCVAVAPDGRTTAVGTRDGTIDLYEVATGQVRRRVAGPGVGCADLAFTPDGSKLLSAGTDQCVLVWPVRLRDVALTAELKRETSAARLWDRMTTGDAGTAYPAAARLAADPAAAVRMARLRLARGEGAAAVGDGRVVELLEAIGSADARAVLRDAAAGDPDRALARAARTALARLGESPAPSVIQTTGGTGP